jgi:hypothetical protein
MLRDFDLVWLAEGSRVAPSAMLPSASLADPATVNLNQPVRPEVPKPQLRLFDASGRTVEVHLCRLNNRGSAPGGLISRLSGLACARPIATLTMPSCALLNGSGPGC